MKLLDELRAVIGRKQYSRATQKCYLNWCERYIRWHRDKAGKWVHPRELREQDVEAWLNHLANVDHVSASTQNQAFAAVLFLYREVLRIELQDLDACRAKRSQWVPTVLAMDEVAALRRELSGWHLLAADLLYGCGMRVKEVVELRVKDVDFANRHLIVRQSKGKKDRVVGLPDSLISPLRNQIEQTRGWWEMDRRDGVCRVQLPHAMERKSPAAASDMAWYFVFASSVRSTCPETKRVGRHHVDKDHLGRMISNSAKKAGLLKRVTCHTLRHSYATHHLSSGTDIVSIQKLLGHSDVRTTQIYTHVTEYGPQGLRSPLERLLATAPRRVSEDHATYRVMG